MFLLDTAFAVESIALVAGAFLLAWLKKSQVKCAFSKFVGVFVVIVSFLGMACSFYYALEYRKAGFLDPQKIMQMHHMPSKMQMMETEK